MARPESEHQESRCHFCLSVHIAVSTLLCTLPGTAQLNGWSDDKQEQVRKSLDEFLDALHKVEG